MKITFLGTSHGVPEKGRRCSCTLVEIGKNRYFIDMGTNAVEQLRDADLYSFRFTQDVLTSGSI